MNRSSSFVTLFGKIPVNFHHFSVFVFRHFHCGGPPLSIHDRLLAKTGDRFDISENLVTGADAGFAF